jgi:hypothetical protein
MRFNTEPNDLAASSTQISCRLVEIYNESGAEEFINAYLSWFKEKNINGWLKIYKTPKYDEKNLALLKQYKKWAVSNEISYTPATILNRKIFPGSYGYDDLVYVINDIIEHENSGKIVFSE